jgi:hypothetical protein
MAHQPLAKYLEATWEQSLEHWCRLGNAALGEEEAQETFIRGYCLEPPRHRELDRTLVPPDHMSAAARKAT